MIRSVIGEQSANTHKRAEGSRLSRLGQPIDVATAVVFLASHESRMMNGADQAAGAEQHRLQQRQELFDVEAMFHGSTRRVFENGFVANCNTLATAVTDTSCRPCG